MQVSLLTTNCQTTTIEVFKLWSVAPPTDSQTITPIKDLNDQPFLLHYCQYQLQNNQERVNSAFLTNSLLADCGWSTCTTVYCTITGTT